LILKKLKASILLFLYIDLKGTDLNNQIKREQITGAKSDFLNELIKDCVYYGLGDDDSLRYIEMRFKQSITKSILWCRKARIRSDESGNLWLSYFTRIGFLLEHKKLLELTERLIDTSMHELFREFEKPYEFKERDPDHVGSHELKNDLKIMKLKSDIRESIKLYRELMSDSPIAAQVKKEIEANGNLRI
jgi:hypothetical protein